MSSLALTLLGGSLLVFGFTTQNVSVVYWTSAAISPFGILLYANLFFVSFFGAVLLAYAAWTRDWRVLRVADSARQRSLFVRGSLAQIACAVGLLNILNGFLIVYASPPDRTPPLIQAVLQNSGVLFSVPASKFVLGDRKHYASAAPLFAGALIALSIFVSVLPTLLSGASGEFAGGGAAQRWAWMGLYLLGIIPGAAYNVMQQLFLIRSGALVAGVSARHIVRASLRALFYCNAAQLTWLLILFFLDFLPFFGASSSPAEWASNTSFSLRCSLGLVSGGGCVSFFNAPPAVWAAAFAGGYCISYIGSVLLNRESAAFNMVCAVITTCVTSAYFLVPRLNPNAVSTPVWSVLVSLILSLGGMVIWKRWESATPAEEQFAAADGGGVAPDEARAEGALDAELDGALYADLLGGAINGDAAKGGAAVAVPVPPWASAPPRSAATSPGSGGSGGDAHQPHAPLMEAWR